MANLIVKGPPLNISGPDKGIGEYFFEQAEKYRDNIFQINGDNGNTETYQEVKQKSTKAAIQLQKIGIQPKDIVLICCRNNTDNVIPVLAALYVGAYVSSVDPKQTASDVKHAIGLVEPKVIFVEEDSVSLIEKGLENSSWNPHIIVIGNSDKYERIYDVQIELEEEQNFQPIKQRGSDVAIIIFSSGTTSAPKGIYLSNSCILNSAQMALQHKYYISGVVLHFSSFYWISTWSMTAICMTTGSAKVVSPSVNAEKFLQLVDKYKIAHVFTSGTFTYGITDLPEDIINKYDTSSLRHLSIVGSTMDPKQILRLRQLLPHSYVAMGYGSSEAHFIAGFSCTDHITDRKGYEEKVSSSGRLGPGVELKIIDLDTGTPLGPNKEGEIGLKSHILMSGYHNFEKPDTFDEDGFLKTGDVGYYDEDQYIYITDRVGEMFKYRINHLSPSVLEETLLKHSAVATAVAFGVPHPVDRNHPAACVVLKKGTNPSVQELQEFVNSQVSDAYQLRAGVMIVDSFPKTPTGKIQKRTLRDMFVKAKKEN